MEILPAIVSILFKSRKGHYRELFDHISKQGFVKIRADGEIINLAPGLKLDRYKTHDIEIVIDRDTGSSILGRGNGSILAQINTNDNRDVADDFPIDYESGLKVKYT